MIKEWLNDAKNWLADKFSYNREIFSFEKKEITELFELKYILIVVASFFLAVIIGMVYGFREGNLPENKNRVVYVKISPGMNAREIGALLETKRVIANSNRFWLLAKFRGYESSFLAGSYKFHEGAGTEAALNKLKSGEMDEIKIVVPEGFTVKDIAKRLESEGVAKSDVFLQKAKNFRPYDYIEKRNDVDFAAEGFLFPATYKFDSDITEDEILNTMAKTFDHRLTKAMRDRAKEMNLSIYKLITMASLIEKEAKFKEDQPIIAQVFYKRLSLNMPLQSDATLQYLMDAPKEDVSLSDTELESPYNTYQNAGLPPGPVANPGEEAINAALYPADTDYLYFVADREGHNHYTYNYSDHLDKVHEVR